MGVAVAGRGVEALFGFGLSFGFGFGAVAGFARGATVAGAALGVGDDTTGVTVVRAGAGAGRGAGSVVVATIGASGLGVAFVSAGRASAVSFVVGVFAAGAFTLRVD